MSVIYTPRKPDLDGRMLIFPVAISASILVLFMRLWYFQVVKAQELQERADASRSVEVTRAAPRGLIYDRNGELIAGVKPEFVVTAMWNEIKKHPEVIQKVASILKVDVKKLQAKLVEAKSKPDLFTPIYVGAGIEDGVKIAETRDDLPGIGVDLQPMRYYPDSKSFTHVLGYVWTPADKDVKRIEAFKKKPADYVGKSGAERAFELNLMGEPGTEEREIDAKRRSVRSMGGSAPTPGDQVILSIDSKLQKFATQYMADHHYVGAVVALDPKTGEVLCLVSSPTYDQNLFSSGITKNDWTALSNDPDKPLIDRAIVSSYAPGSTFKIVTSIAAYERHIFDTSRYIVCDGGVHSGKAFFKCLSSHGPISYYDALAKSCNSYFYEIGREVGVDALRKASEEVGFGEREGLEIGDAKGVNPTKEYMAKHHPKTKWYEGDTLNFAIGQGYIAATPLQLANMAAMVANSGVRYKPHLLHAIRPANGKGPDRLAKPEVAAKIDASPEFWDALHKALIGVVDHGTAAGAKIPGTVWAGKTGSAEHGNKTEKTNAVFVGYAPAEDPKIAVCVLIETVGHGGDFAAPPAKDIVEAYLAEGKSSALSKKPASDSAAAALAASPTAR